MLVIFPEQKEVISEAVQADEFVKPAVFEALAPNDITHPVIEFIESPIAKGPEALIEWRD
jgi:hypothetical protein